MKYSQNDDCICCVLNNYPSIDSQSEMYYVIRQAFRSKDHEHIKSFIQDPDSNTSLYRIIAEHSAKGGHINIIRLLLAQPRFDHSDPENCMIDYACWYGHVDLVKLLLEDAREDPSRVHNYAIKAAAEGGNVQIIQMLLEDERVDPSDDGNSAICLAIERGNYEAVDTLSDDPRVDLGVGLDHAIAWDQKPMIKLLRLKISGKIDTGA